MDLEEAKAILKDTKRIELRDHAFGDCEIEWVKEGQSDAVAWGYFGSSGASVTVTTDTSAQDFVYADAHALRRCGTLEIHRNDELGPEEYTEGVALPGLSIEGVRKELTEE